MNKTAEQILDRHGFDFEAFEFETKNNSLTNYLKNHDRSKR